ncbi:ion transporter [Pleionea sp. CnH1-48]|uniref:ion transporter n=1 Tax=Pleionea sp. CnH1-48 TaxID=2954494 RepID=UPI002096DA32|nr:ion transporter [Pleionea sp. CnH1-48]MCO7225157.1 ion transporter [Pleionea sp. CnH1-48]
MKAKLEALVESTGFQNFIMALIIVNAIILGLETSPTVQQAIGTWLGWIDGIILAVFVVEIVLRLFVYRLKFFKDPWGIFDLTIVVIALIPATGPFAVVRALRVLRVLRLISVAPSMRSVVSALLQSLPGMGAIVALLSLIFYVSAVMATNLFGSDFPEWFGTLGKSFYSLFQIMTLESWSMGIVRPVMEKQPMAWMFFVPFILIATFTMLNLFIAVVVNAMQTRHEQEQGKTDKKAIKDAHDERQALHDEVIALRKDIQLMSQKLEQSSRQS